MITLAVLFSCNAVAKHILHQRMMQYSIASASEDGEPNRVVMNGKPGFLGYSFVYLRYLENGWIRLTGENLERAYEQKMISEFVLEPGMYTLTGLNEQRNTIDLQLSIKDDMGFYRYIYQYDEDMSFTTERTVNAILYIRVHPEVEGIDVKARPAVYRND